MAATARWPKQLAAALTSLYGFDTYCDMEVVTETKSRYEHRAAALQVLAVNYPSWI